MKSSYSMTSAYILAFKAFKPASLQMRLISAPEYPSVFLLNSSMLTSPFIGILFPKIFTLKISYLHFRSGGGTYTKWSNLPGLVRALSRISGLFVAPMTITLFKASMPSYSFKSVISTRSLTSVPPDRYEAIASISSKKITEGLQSLAF